MVLDARALVAHAPAACHGALPDAFTASSSQQRQLVSRARRIVSGVFCPPARCGGASSRARCCRSPPMRPSSLRHHSAAQICQRQEAGQPSSRAPAESSYTLPGLDGGDLWAGAREHGGGARSCERGDVDHDQRAGDGAVQPGALVAVARGQGTIAQAVLPREVLGNALMALLVSSVWPQAEFAGVEKVWLYSSSIISFTLSFFLGQSYTLWRNVYSKSRGIQGRLNDVGLLCATAAERNASAVYTDDAEDLLKTVARPPLPRVVLRVARGGLRRSRRRHSTSSSRRVRSPRPRRTSCSSRRATTTPCSSGSPSSSTQR